MDAEPLRAGVGHGRGRPDLGGEGSRGKVKGSNQGIAGVRLQNLLPRARVLYASATGASDVNNLAYATRLGLWGPETAFTSREAFVADIRDGGIAAMELTRFQLLMALLVFYIVLGMFLDGISAIVLTMAVVEPMIREAGIDLIWFGVLIGANVQTSFMHPPFGFALFYLKGVAPPEVKIQQIYKGIIPFVMLQVFGLFLCVVFPALILWLPSFALGG